MKDPNLAYEIFKILLKEYVSCESSKANDEEMLDKLITDSFNISDQLVSRIEADPDIIAAKAEKAAVKAKQAAAMAHHQKAQQKPKIIAPEKS